MTTLFHKTAPVQAAILVEMIRMLQEASRDFTMPSFLTAPVKPEPPSESYRLKQAGFTNAKPIADYERLTKQYEKAMKKWRKRTDAVLEDIRFDNMTYDEWVKQAGEMGYTEPDWKFKPGDRVTVHREQHKTNGHEGEVWKSSKESGTGRTKVEVFIEELEGSWLFDESELTLKED